MSEHIKNDIQTIADHYGIVNQLIKLSEESAEVIQAASKVLISKKEDDPEYLVDIYENLFEELADLSILSDQVVYLLGCEENVTEYRKYKLKRTINEINRKPFNAKEWIRE